MMSSFLPSRSSSPSNSSIQQPHQHHHHHHQQQSDDLPFAFTSNATTSPPTAPPPPSPSVNAQSIRRGKNPYNPTEAYSHEHNRYNYQEGASYYHHPSVEESFQQHGKIHDPNNGQAYELHMDYYSAAAVPGREQEHQQPSMMMTPPTYSHYQPGIGSVGSSSSDHYSEMVSSARGTLSSSHCSSNVARDVSVSASPNPNSVSTRIATTSTNYNNSNDAVLEEDYEDCDTFVTVNEFETYTNHPAGNAEEHIVSYAKSSTKNDNNTIKSSSYSNNNNKDNKRDILSMLLSGNVQGEDVVSSTQEKEDTTTSKFSLLNHCENASRSATLATDALYKQQYHIALEQFTTAAKLYCEAAMQIRNVDSSLANSLLLLSHSLARRGTTIKDCITSRNFNDGNSNNDIGLSNKDGDASEKKKDQSENEPNDSAALVLSNKNGLLHDENDSCTTKKENHEEKHEPDSSASSSSVAAPEKDSSGSNNAGNKSDRRDSSSTSEKLRAVVRGAMDRNHTIESDMSASVFLGETVKQQQQQQTLSQASNPKPLDASAEQQRQDNDAAAISQQAINHNNPIDDMMKLERELNNMDMQLGNSVASLAASTQSLKTIIGSASTTNHTTNHARNSNPWNNKTNIPNNNTNALMEGSFYVVSSAANNHNATPPAVGGRMMSSSTLLTPTSRLPPKPPPHRHHADIVPANGSNPSTTNNNSNDSAAGLESSWWGNASTLSANASLHQTAHQHQNHHQQQQHPLASSTSSWLSTTSSSTVNPHRTQQSTNHHPPSPPHSNPSATNAKQMMRLLDSLKTLGDENATLMAQVEDAQNARLEAKAAREEMKRFKTEYNKRFSMLKSHLDKAARQQRSSSSSTSGLPVRIPASGNNTNANPKHNHHPVLTSQYFMEEQKNQQHTNEIQTLKAQLVKQQEDAKKKDAALKKYENFYKEVKARSAQRSKERAMQQQQQQQQEEQKRSRTQQQQPQVVGQNGMRGQQQSRQQKINHQTSQKQKVGGRQRGLH